MGVAIFLTVAVLTAVAATVTLAAGVRRNVMLRRDNRRADQERAVESDLRNQEIAEAKQFINEAISTVYELRDKTRRSAGWTALQLVRMGESYERLGDVQRRALADGTRLVDEGLAVRTPDGRLAVNEDYVRPEELRALVQRDVDEVNGIVESAGTMARDLKREVEERVGAPLTEVIERAMTGRLREMVDNRVLQFTPLSVLADDDYVAWLDPVELRTPEAHRLATETDLIRAEWRNGASPPPRPEQVQVSAPAPPAAGVPPVNRAAATEGRGLTAAVTSAATSARGNETASRVSEAGAAAPGPRSATAPRRLFRRSGGKGPTA